MNISTPPTWNMKHIGDAQTAEQSVWQKPLTAANEALSTGKKSSMKGLTGCWRTLLMYGTVEFQAPLETKNQPGSKTSPKSGKRKPSLPNKPRVVKKNE